MKRENSAPVRPASGQKRREVLFSRFPPNQPQAAAELLAGLDNLRAAASSGNSRAVIVDYHLLDYTLRGIEEGLIDQGFHLDNSLMSKLTRALINYCEETQLHNMHSKERRTKVCSNEAYANAWERHPHGDHDDTPPEWREYK